MKFNEINQIVKVARPAKQTFQKDDVIWQEGERIDGIGLLESGSLLRKYFPPDGRILVQGVFTPPDLIGVEAAVSRLRTSPTHVIAGSDGDFIWFPFSDIFENPRISDDLVRTLQANLLAYLADDCIRFMRKADILARRTTRDRVLMYLSILREKQGDEIDIAMSQEMLAQYLCVDRTTLSDELNKMRRDGLIEFTKTLFTLHLEK